MRKTMSQVLDGFEYRIRKDGRVARVRAASGETVAEVVTGKRAVRVNVQSISPETEQLAAQEGLVFTGNSRMWAGGLRVTSTNVRAIRRILRHVVDEANRTAMLRRNAQRTLEVIAADGALQTDLLDALEAITRDRPEALEEVRKRIREVAAERQGQEIEAA